MPLGWNEIKQRAIQFSREWAGEQREDAEGKSFWDEFFNVFGVRRRTVATFEEPVRNLKGQFGYIDLFWRGKLLVEHKSFGKSLDKAESQAFQYIQDLATEGRHDETPRYVIVSDFARIALHDLEPEEQLNLPLFAGRRIATLEFPLAELHRHVRDFAFIAGYTQHRLDPEDPANIRAAETMGRLHDALAAGGYAGHPLERLLVRVLFCLFAEDTGIFEPNAFTGYLETRTRDDGSDLGLHLGLIFQVLNTPDRQRQANLDENLARFPYVNGGLFAEALPLAAFNRDMRNALIACTRFDWSRISPAIFGSLFQSVMEPAARRQVGAHYTSERDILKLIRSLFLDDLRAEFAKLRNSRPKLEEFHRKLGSLRFLDPACGCGNFLVIAYRELRILEMEVIEALHGWEQGVTDISLLSRVDVDQFYGIEINEFPARIAETALWLMDHQMNVALSARAGRYFQRLPLKKSATIRVGNALRLDWKAVLPPEQCSYVLGNPPFVGKKEQNAEQKADMRAVWADAKGCGVLDYVTCWYVRAAEYIQKTKIAVGFVSTNSISQGEQVGIFWNALFGRGMKIHFAHRTFPWESEARGKAHVHVVIIGFGCWESAIKRIYDYEGETPTVSEVRNISPYLTEGPDLVILARQQAVNGAPPICYGSMMIDKDRKAGDDAGLILTPEHRDAFLAESPALAPYIRPLCGGDEFLNGTPRFCLWLVGVPPSLVRESALLRQRMEGVRRFRESSGREQTRKLAATPTLFGEIRQPSSSYLLIPKVSSETRRYIPIGFLQPETIASGSALIVTGATVYQFGVLSSAFHNAWMRTVAGRMKSDYQYSSQIVYNNFPWPEAPEARQKAAVEAAAQAILDARARYPTSSLADLYDPLSMPPDLVKAHQELDRAVDRCYRTQPFTSDRQRVEFLFALYEHLTAPLVPAAPRAHPRRGKG